MYSVSVRDHFMIAHSFAGEVFGPARRLHGATYVVDVEFRRSEIDADGVVVDIGRAIHALRAVLGELNFKNLDDEAAFAGRNTTTEFLSRVVFDRMATAIRLGDLGAGARHVESLRVTLHESHIARASFEERLRPHRAENAEIRGAVSPSVRAGGGAPAPVKEERLRPARGEDKQIRGEGSASVRAGGGAPAPVKEERLRPARGEDKRIRGEGSPSVRAGGGAPAPVKKGRVGKARARR